MCGRKVGRDSHHVGDVESSVKRSVDADPASQPSGQPGAVALLAASPRQTLGEQRLQAILARVRAKEAAISAHDVSDACLNDRLGW